MSETRKAPSNAATLLGAEWEEISSQGCSSPAHPTTPSLPRQENRGRVAAVLPEGKRNARPGREIARVLGFRSTREVSAAVERERRLGLPICASCDSDSPGYYLASGPDELEEYLNSLRRRLRAVGRTATALEEALAAWRGQERLKLPGEGEGRRTT